MADSLVGKQMRRWEIDQRIKRRFEEDELSCGMETPVVTISRQWGSGGTNVAKLVAKELDFKLYDKEIINHVAEMAGARPSQIQDHDEQHRDVVSDLILQFLEGKRPTAAGYMRALVKTLKRIGEEGNAVVIGRGANYILPAALNVRIIAREELRVARISELHSVEQRAARRMVMNSDRQRFRFVKSHFGVDWDDPMTYDFVLNTEHLSIEHAANLIIKAFSDRRKGLEDTCRVIGSSSATGR